MADQPQMIVVLPGIGGSVLARPGRPEDVVWDAGKGDIANLVFQPGRMRIDEAPHLTPTGLTESTKFMGFTVIPGYETLLGQLARFGRLDARGDPQHPLPGVNVVAVPYDFRRSIVEAAERLDSVVCAHLAGTSQAERAKLVTVVAHSMGGLVARVWLGMLGRWPWCRTLITLGTPHRGAPKALGWLVNGVPLLRGTTEMLRGWPAVVQLLPRYPAVRDTAVADKHASGAALYPHQLPVGWLTEPARAAYDLHVTIERCCGDIPRSGPNTVACIGWSHPTPNAAFWDGRQLRITKNHPDWLGLDGWERDFGDGTVPSFSALPPEMDDDEHSPVRLVQRHVPLAHAGIVADLLRRPTTMAPPRQVHGAQYADRPPAIGLDLEEVHGAGQSIPLRAAIREVDADISGQRVWARLRRIVEGRPSSAGQIDMQLDWDSLYRDFRGELAGQREGLYEIRVSAREVPRAGNIPDAKDTVAVVEP